MYISNHYHVPSSHYDIDLLKILSLSFLDILFLGIFPQTIQKINWLQTQKIALGLFLLHSLEGLYDFFYGYLGICQINMIIGFLYFLHHL
jgi:hypothetical protein